MGREWQVKRSNITCCPLIYLLLSLHLVTHLCPPLPAHPPLAPTASPLHIHTSLKTHSPKNLELSVWIAMPVCLFRDMANKAEGVWCKRHQVHVPSLYIRASGPFSWSSRPSLSSWFMPSSQSCPRSLPAPPNISYESTVNPPCGSPSSLGQKLWVLGSNPSFVTPNNPLNFHCLGFPQ